MADIIELFRRIARTEDQSPRIQWIFAGLGNPGPEHALDRHNAGFRLVDTLAGRQGVRFGLESKEHVVHPYFLKQYLRRWYLFATIEGKDFITCFSLDRILSVRQNDEVAFRETCIDFNHYFDDIVGVTHPDGGVVEHIVIEGDCWAEYYLRTLPIHPLQQLESLGEEGCRLTMDLMVNHELEREILSYGEHLTVKAPEALRTRMAALLGILLEGYLEV